MMIVKLPNGAWERREDCGCSAIYSGLTRSRYQCTGHKTTPSGWWEEILTKPEVMPVPYTHEHVPGVGAVSLHHLIGKAVFVLSRFLGEAETIRRLQEQASPVTLEEWQDLIFWASTQEAKFRNRCRMASTESERADHRHAAFALLKIVQFAGHMVEALRTAK